MSTTIAPTPSQSDQAHTGQARRGDPAVTGHPVPPAPPLPPRAAPRHARGGRVLFTVGFESAMTDSDVARLASELDLWSHMDTKLHRSPTSPGVARLDHFSGLFLERGVRDGTWVLEARTWGRPAPTIVHGWHLEAANAARQLDATVHWPAPLARTGAAIPGRLAKHRRWAVARPRLASLS